MARAIAAAVTENVRLGAIIPRPPTTPYDHDAQNFGRVVPIQPSEVHLSLIHISEPTRPISI
eukprot:1283943-Amorphochlora_amoeboformis.AAC.1